jgi:hypothetical protein
MKVVFQFITLVFISTQIGAQPYFLDFPGSGLGQYGFIEKDAVTFARIARNNYNNVRDLAARWYVDDLNPANGNGVQKIYTTASNPIYAGSITWQCGGFNDANRDTKDFVAADFGAEWHEGATAYVSVYSEFCDFATQPVCYQTNNTGCTVGLSERRFDVIDVEPYPVGVSTNVFNGNACGVTADPNNVVGSFFIHNGGYFGRKLNRFFFENTSGSAREGTNIGNNGFRLYYEPRTGTEVFNGNENFVQLYGDWNADPTNNDVYGADNLNISLNSGTNRTRFYLVICNYNLQGNFYLTVRPKIINDGLSMLPLVDNHSLVRINSTDISLVDVPLPIEFVDLQVRKSFHNQLNWTVNDGAKAKGFSVEKSLNGRDFVSIGNMNANLFGIKHYSFIDNQTSQETNFYRILCRNTDNQISYSKIVKVDQNNTSKKYSVVCDAKDNYVSLRYEGIINERVSFQIYDLAGRLVTGQMFTLTNGIGDQYLLAIGMIKNNIYIAKVTDSRGSQSFKFQY